MKCSNLQYQNIGTLPSWYFLKLPPISDFFVYKNASPLNHVLFNRDTDKALFGKGFLEPSRLLALLNISIAFFFDFYVSVIWNMNFSPNKFWSCFWSNTTFPRNKNFTFLESFMRWNNMSCRHWYEFEHEDCPINNIVFPVNVWDWSIGIVIVSSCEFFKSSNPL